MEQLDAFDDARALRRRAGQAARDAGIARVERRQEAADSGWTLRAAEYLRDYGSRVAQGQPFIVEEARIASASRLARPLTAKAWGPAIQLAQRRGWIEKARDSSGFPIFRPVPSSNDSWKPAWVTRV